jgi:hypothetical protein
MCASVPTKICLHFIFRWMNPTIFTCAICGKLVPLEMAKIDERGQSVHEHCYTAQIASQQPHPFKPSE